MDPYETFIQNLDIGNNPVIPGLSRGGGRVGRGDARTNRGNDYFSLSDNPQVNASNYYNTAAAAAVNNDNFSQSFNSASHNNIRPTRIAKKNNYFDNNSAAGFSGPTNFADPSGFNPNGNNTFMGGGGGGGVGATRGRKRQRFPGKSNNNGRTNENLITGDLGYSSNKSTQAMDNFIIRNNTFFWGAMVGALRNNPDVIVNMLKEYDKNATEFRNIRQSEYRQKVISDNNNLSGGSTNIADESVGVSGGVGGGGGIPFRNKNNERFRDNRPSTSAKRRRPPDNFINNENDMETDENENDGPNDNTRGGGGGDDGGGRPTNNVDTDDDYNFNDSQGMNNDNIYTNYEYPPSSSEYLNLLKDIENDYNIGKRPGVSYLGKQSLSIVLEDLNLTDLWTSSNYKTSFSLLISKFIRLFSYNYSNEYENFIVYMLQISMDSLNTVGNINSSYNTKCSKNKNDDTNKIYTYEDMYVARSKDLYKFASFRFFIEVVEFSKIITRKNKEDLIMLYMLLTIPDISIYRDANSDLHYEKYLNPVDGRSLKTSSLINRPFFINLRVEGIFGNISKNVKKLERGINNCFTNYKKKLRNCKSKNSEYAVATEISILLQNASVISGLGSIQPTDMLKLKLFHINKNEENKRLNNMLRYTLIVSMMAEEFRVYMSNNDNLKSKMDKSLKNKTSCKFGTSKDNLIFSNNLPLFYRFSIKNLNTIDTKSFDENNDD